MDDIQEQKDFEMETPSDHVFIAPSISTPQILSGISYTYHSSIPKTVQEDMSIPCVLGVDEAGRGPVLGPMVYGLLYLPLTIHHTLLAETHHFDDSKVLTPAVRSDLLQKIATPGTDLYDNCGWATRTMSAQDISADMLRPTATYNLNAQAMDATIDLIKDVFAKGVNVTEIYIDTIGRPETYQAKLAKIFPSTNITVAKKADSLYPCVSAASVCAKVTRDAALEVSYEAYSKAIEGEPPIASEGWGSGYPSDARCVNWLKRNMDPVFGWNNACRFSWGTSKDMLDAKGIRVEWPAEEDEENLRVTDYFRDSAGGKGDGLGGWFGAPVTTGDF
jgi:ribonuclease H2 subunit A